MSELYAAARESVTHLIGAQQLLRWATVWPQETWAENYGVTVPLSVGDWLPIQHNVACAEAYLRTKWHLDPSNHLATIRQRCGQTDTTDRTTVPWHRANRYL